ncbi:MAG: DUF4386 domain-containing protein [Sideroxyarcus sp.]|nr:DUF4386 domain-containing protein [Sideroxyarcus sp.]
MNSRKREARIAGFMFLFYIVTGIASMVLFNQATGGAEGTAAKLASIAQHAPLVRWTALLGLLTFFVAVMLAVALYVLTRDQNPYLAIVALCCRAAEGMINALSAVGTLGLLSAATASTVAAAPDSAAAHALGVLLLQQDGSSFLISATCFAVGSTLYSYLFLCARSIPVPLAWLGVVASVLLVVSLPLQIAGFIKGTWFVWIPMLVFEVALGLWLLIKGVAAQTTST